MLTKSTFLLVLGVAMAMANMNLQLLNVDYDYENGQLRFAEVGATGQFQCLGYPIPCEEAANQNGVQIDGQCWVLVSQLRPSQATHSFMG